MMPKCRGETPTPVTTGSRMGVRMTMAARASMNTPTMSSSTLMSSRMMILLSVMPSIQRAMVPGTSSMVMMLPNRVAMAMSTMMTDEVSHDLTQDAQTLLKSISRYRNTPTMRP